MKTKTEIIAALKLEYPTLKSGSDETGYRDLSLTEYEAIIELWADNQMAAELAQAEAEAKEEAKTVLLNRLGITADEAKLLLS